MNYMGETKIYSASVVITVDTTTNIQYTKHMIAVAGFRH